MAQRITVGIFVTVFLIAIVLFTLSKYGNSSSNSFSTTSASQAEKITAVVKPVMHVGQAAANTIDSGSNQADPQDITKIQVLNEILKSKNDNDPRLDNDFKNLSENAKRLMRNEYKAMNPESFNEKGTIVFLLGQNLTAPQDFDFLGEVLTEPPCTNIEDCSKPADKGNSQFADDEGINDVTTSYPQIVSLKNLEKFLAREDVSPTLKDLALRDLKLAQGSKNGRIARMSQNIQQHLANPSVGF